MSKPLTLFEARARVLAAPLPELASESVALAAAHGRVLAQSLAADGPWPATDRAAMDGFAVCAGAGLAVGTTLPVVGESLAGRPFARALAATEAIRIMTGAVVPAGADAVVPVEQTSGFQGALVTLASAVRTGQHVRPRGSEMAAGRVVLPAGTRVRAQQLGVLAVLGHTQVPVVRRPRVAIVATGDEVVPVEVAPLPHQVRESNSWALAAQVAECGGEAVRLGIAPDEPAALRAMLAAGLEAADVLVTIGGISKGTHDLVHGTLGELGVRTDFHGIDLKPGKPTYFGLSGRVRGAACVFGLPGNPASSFTVFDLLVRPLLARLQGEAVGEWTAALPVVAGAWQPNTRLQAVPARVRSDAHGAGLELTAPSPSGDPFSLLAGEVYALVPGSQAMTAGATLRVVGGACGVRLP